jgi:hypothetical protein
LRHDGATDAKTRNVAGRDLLVLATGNRDIIDEIASTSPTPGRARCAERSTPSVPKIVEWSKNASRISRAPGSAGRTRALHLRHARTHPRNKISPNLAKQHQPRRTRP